MKAILAIAIAHAMSFSVTAATGGNQTIGIVETGTPSRKSSRRSNVEIIRKRAWINMNKEATVILAVALVLASPTLAAAAPSDTVVTKSILKETHEFVAESGKKVRGRILAYHPEHNAVTIRTEDNLTRKVGLDTLSGTDRAYILEWHSVGDFFSKDRFRISVKRAHTPGRIELLVWKPQHDVSYAITLHNRSSSDLNGLSLEYGVYYKPHPPPGNRQLEFTSHGAKHGTLDVGTVAAGKAKRVFTPPLKFPTESLFEYYKGSEIPAAKLLGIWIRIYLPLESGKKAMREFSSPGSLMETHKWIPPDDPSSPNNRQEE